MKSIKLIVAYPQPKDVSAFDKDISGRARANGDCEARWEDQNGRHQDLDRLTGNRRFIASRRFIFHPWRSLQQCAESAGGKETLANAAKISSGGPPVIMIAEEDTFTF